MQGRSDNRQLVLAILGAAAGVALLLASVILLSGNGRPAGGIAPIASTWAIPLASLFVIVGVTWLLLSQKPRESGTGPRVYDSCPSCERSVMRDWRLCPYCGEVLENLEQHRAAEIA